MEWWGCASSAVGNGAKSTAGTAELGSCCCYSHVCNIAFPLSLQSLQANREYREQLKIVNEGDCMVNIFSYDVENLQMGTVT